MVGNPHVLDKEAATVKQKELKIDLVPLPISTNLVFKEEISISFGWYQKESPKKSIILAVSSRAIGGQTK